jgi:hypothetical protein
VAAASVIERFWEGSSKLSGKRKAKMVRSETLPLVRTTRTIEPTIAVIITVLASAPAGLLTLPTVNEAKTIKAITIVDTAISVLKKEYKSMSPTCWFLNFMPNAGAKAK